MQDCAGIRKCCLGDSVQDLGCLLLLRKVMVYYTQPTTQYSSPECCLSRLSPMLNDGNCLVTTPTAVSRWYLFGPGNSTYGYSTLCNNTR